MIDFSVLADRDCLAVFAAAVLCSDRGVESNKMGHDYGGIAHLTAKGAAGRTGLSQAASGRALRRLEETGLIIGNGDGDAWRTSGASSGGEWHDRFGGRNRLVVRPDRDGSASARLRGRCTSPCLWRSGHPAGTQRPLSE